MKATPIPPPQLGSSDEVPGELGFCGAGKLREEIAELDRRVDAVRDAAGQVTIDLPLSASWEGIWRRAELAAQVEAETRTIVGQLAEAAERGRAPVKGFGVEDAAIAIEIQGGVRQRAKVERALPAELLERALPVKVPNPELTRLVVINRVAERRQRVEDRLRQLRPPAQEGVEK